VGVGVLAVAEVLWPGLDQQRWISASDSRWRGVAAGLIWGVPAIVLLVRIARARRAARCILDSARRVAGAEWRTSIAAAARGLGLDAPPEVRVTTAIDVPAAVGLWRRVVVVPERFLDTPEPLRGAVLRHEMEHARRLDVLTRHVSLVARALLWFNPAVWLAARRARLACEQACDAAATDDSRTRAAYGRYLADQVLPPRGIEASVVAPLGAADLVARLEALTDSTDARPRPGISWALALLLVAAALWIDLPRPRAMFFLPGGADGSEAGAAVWNRQ
jgi:beta-lactamase regulating signal transducer with metallopeptidase domain